MIHRLMAVTTVLALVTGINAMTNAQELKTGDRIVFLGDSITQAGAGPHGYVTFFRQVLQKVRPDLDVEVIGAGISGNRVPDLQARLERDVLAKDPTVVVIYIGINDVWHSLNNRGTPIDEFESGLKDIIGKIQISGARVVLCTPSVIGEKTDGSNQLDEMLEQYSNVSRKVARETKSQLLDLRKAFLDYLKQHNPDNQEKNILTTDGVHLNAQGNEFVAEQMLKALGVLKPDRRQDDLLRHIVMFQFEDGLADQDVTEIVDAFCNLENKIDSIADFEYGTNISKEGLSNGFTHCFVLTFESEPALQEYLKHQAHLDFVKMLQGKIAKVQVFDYWAK